MKEPKLKELRSRIDRIDLQVLKLLNERAKIALEIAKIKSICNLPLHSPGREREIYQRLKKNNLGPLPPEAVEAIYREVISATISLHRPLSVAYLGPEATFTHLAALRKFGTSAHYLPSSSIKEVFIEVEKERADYGVVPVENSTEGAINYTLDMFVESPLKICDEVLLEISHSLLSVGDKEGLKKVYSHPQPLAQCRLWLEKNLPGVELIEVSSTAEAARLAVQDRSSAAIASEAAAKLYNLKILERKISDLKENYTRFLVIGKREGERSPQDKTSVIFSVKDEPGALYNALSCFYRHKINLSKIESRPSKRKAWEYLFFVDLGGHREDKGVKAALRELKEKALLVKVLGSYPRATLEKGKGGGEVWKMQK